MGEVNATFVRPCRVEAPPPPPLPPSVDRSTVTVVESARVRVNVLPDRVAEVSFASNCETTSRASLV